MAENFPRTVPAFLAWSRVHAKLWAEDPAAIGLSPAQAAAFAALTDELDAAHAAAQAARQAGKAATRRLNELLASTRKSGSALVHTIKAHAQVNDDPGVYPAAGLSRADRPGELPPPAAPQSFNSRINADGSLTLTWSVRQPVGVTDVNYLVHRRIDGGGGGGAFVLIGAAGRGKSFTDATIPPGTRSVEYFIRPQRGQRLGETSPVFTVRFGTAGEEARPGPARAAA